MKGTASPSSPELEDARQALLELARSKVKITGINGKRQTVMLIEARLLELASPTCERRLLCQDFIRLVRMALEMTAVSFRAHLTMRDVAELDVKLR